MNPLQGKRILLGVTGSIAAYKAAELASRLTQSGAEVETILTASAAQFVTPLTFQSVTGRAAHTDADLWGAQAHIVHVGLARPADLFVIAPITANTIAKLAHGIADNLLTLTALAAQCPLLIAPAMDGGMFGSAANQDNLATLKARKVIMVGPEEGHLASGLMAKGRMTEPVDLLGEIRLALACGGPLHARKIVVTAGGTQEPLDPARVLTNLSSGKQGYALAQAALDAGADVTLISAPAALPWPRGARRVDVCSAEEMAAAVTAESAMADALIMAAAVGDFRPEKVENRKIKKESGFSNLRLSPTRDILTEVAKLRAKSGWPLVVVGFAAETNDLQSNALKKLHAKGLDLIAANDILGADSGFSADTNRVVLIDAGGQVESLPLMSKYDVAGRIIGRITPMILSHT
jgi:phosphopantothenoylcysteine decarboxylase / phosphopantothenate---cysteine ligase